jgi:acyl carrier protein
MNMNDCGYEDLYKIILDVIEPKLSQAGFDRNTIKPDTDLMDILDSFGILETIIEIEERAGVSADLAQMDFAKAMTVSGLAKEIIRINSRE